jgi:hypothetical protein
MTDCTSEIGASASAATWKPHDAIATTIPSTNQRLVKSELTALSGLRHSIAGIAAAPRCL